MMMSESKRFLFVIWDGGGTVPPALALAARVLSAGYEVRILGPGSIRDKVLKLGAEFSPYRQAPETDPGKPPEGKEEKPASIAMAACAEYAADVAAEIREHPVELVVADYLLTGACIAAEAAGLPCAAFVPSVYPLPAPGLPPFGSGFPQAKGFPGRVRDSVVNFLFQQFWNRNLKAVNKTRQQHGLAPVRSVREQMLRVGRLFILTSSEFDFPADLPDHVVYCGPQQQDAGQLNGWESPWSGEEQVPLVLISLSTTYQAQEDLIQRLLCSVEGLPIHAVVTLGRAVDPVSLEAPDNVHLASFVPHREILPHTALTITHGGHGTVLKTLSYGVPVLCFPMGRDQGDVAVRVESLGAGLKLSRKADVQAIRSVITRMIENPDFGKAAGAFAARIAEQDEPARAVAELEALMRESEGTGK